MIYHFLSVFHFKIFLNMTHFGAKFDWFQAKVAAEYSHC